MQQLERWGAGQGECVLVSPGGTPSPAASPGPSSGPCPAWPTSTSPCRTPRGADRHRGPAVARVPVSAPLNSVWASHPSPPTLESLEAGLKRWRVRCWRQIHWWFTGVSVVRRALAWWTRCAHARYTLHCGAPRNARVHRSLFPCFPPPHLPPHLPSHSPLPPSLPFEVCRAVSFNKVQGEVPRSLSKLTRLTALYVAPRSPSLVYPHLSEE